MVSRRRLGDNVSSDRSAGSGPILDKHRLPQTLGQLLPEYAREYVRSAARRIRHNDADRLVRIVNG